MVDASAMMERLALSCLDDPSVIRQLGIEWRERAEMAQIGLQARAGFILPYFDLQGNKLQFVRARYCEKREMTDKKYGQVKGTAQRVYFPPLIDWAEAAGDVDVSIIITEGELKAAATTLLGYATIGLGGVDGWHSTKKGETFYRDLEVFEWPNRTVVLIFDSDITDKYQVKRALNDLASELVGRGARVYQAFLPAEPGEKVGLDDFIHKHGGVTGTADAELGTLINRAKEDESNHMLMPLLQLNDLAALNEKESRYYKRTERLGVYHPIAAGMLRDTLSGFGHIHRVVGETKNGEPKIQKVDAVQVWRQWEHKTSVDGFEVSPSEGWVTDNGKLNLWQGYGTTPKEGDCSDILEYMRTIICGGDSEDFDSLDKLLMWKLQNPEKVAGVYITLLSQQGTGKGTLGNFLNLLWGDHYTQSTAGEGVLTPFNPLLLNSIILFLDEVGYIDSDKYDRLKTLATEPYITINRKGVDQIRILNCNLIIVTSNRKDILKLSHDDRRALLLSVSLSRQQDVGYFTNLRYKMENGGAAAYLYRALNYDLQGWTPQHIDLRNKTRARYLASTLDPLHRYLVDCGNTCEIQTLQEIGKPHVAWPDHIKVEALFADYKSWAQTGLARGESIGSLSRFMRDLGEIFGTATVSRKMVRGVRANWFTVPTIPEFRSKLEEATSAQLDWDGIPEPVTPKF